MTRVYLVPRIETPTPIPAWRPAYCTGGAIANSLRAVLTYGGEPWALVFADTSAAEHAAIIAHADATALPADLDSQIGAALATVQGKLEAADIPADWVTASMTYRTVLQWVIRIFLLMQRFQHFGAALDLLFSTIGLDGLVGDLSATTRQRLNTAATSLGLDTSSITLATTIRTALRILGQQMTFPVSLAGEVV